MPKEPLESILKRIYLMRGVRVMLDADLADLYAVATKRLNEQVKRNRLRFPADFVFQVTQDEWKMWSQNATTSQRHRRADSLPFAFTEHGCLMLSNVLRSQHAVAVSVLIVRAFVTLRSAIATNADLAVKVDQLDAELSKHGAKLLAHDTAILKLLAEIRRLTGFAEKPRRAIGYTADWKND